MYLLLGSLLLPLGIWCSTVWSFTIIIGCVLCISAFKMHLFAHGECFKLHNLFFREDHTTPSESLWTLQLKRSRVVFCNPMYFAIFLQCAVTENLNQVYNL